MDTALKQRLVGASVLIALAVVVLPMILGGRPEGDVQETQKIELPPQPPELDVQTRRYPVGEQPRASVAEDEPGPVKALPTPVQVPEPETNQTGSGEDTAPAESTVEPESEETPQPPVAEQAASEPALREAPGEPVITPLQPPSETPTQTGRYVVQVASFGALDNANRLAATLRDYGYSVMLDSVKSDSGTLHRVRVGPYSEEPEASKVVSRLQSQVKGIKPRVMDLQPEKAAQVTQPSDPLVRWVVQVGSFGDAANADNLVARLRLESMSAYKEQVTRTGSTIYRVRVGPFLERDDAIKANRLVAERLSIDGVVMSAD